MNELFDEQGRVSLAVIAPDQWIVTDDELADVLDRWQKNLGDTP